jgi:hypothetical protein
MAGEKDTAALIVGRAAAGTLGSDRRRHRSRDRGRTGRSGALSPTDLDGPK